METCGADQLIASPHATSPALNAWLIDGACEFLVSSIMSSIQGSLKRAKLKNRNAFPAFPPFWRWKRAETAQEMTWQKAKPPKP
jgi:hypothetical protein